MGAEREIIEEAYAGDIIGVFDPGIFSIGDTLCTPGSARRRYSSTSNCKVPTTPTITSSIPE